ncbi:hypothetical protein AB4Y42_35330 [Paraburkholderia sp. EG286B]|uniref:hypothetical protein n=1 Tax=Paraburkholderia sp. EG286B TaxID=3237011 RepID=UPI0034D34647
MSYVNEHFEQAQNFMFAVDKARNLLAAELDARLSAEINAVYRTVAFAQYGAGRCRDREDHRGKHEPVDELESIF